MNPKNMKSARVAESHLNSSAFNSSYNDNLNNGYDHGVTLQLAMVLIKFESDDHFVQLYPSFSL